MSAEESRSNDPFELTDQEKWKLDDIIMQYWDAKNQDEKKKIELDCYKQFKWMGFKDVYIDYLRENDCEALADEMEHFVNVFQKAPHDHEKRLAA
jgi:hypothetical protein